MDAPTGRYRVIEKDGRLIVIDNETGSPIPSSLASPPARVGGPSGSPSPIAPAGPGTLDRAAGLLLALAVRKWDEQGRAVIAWEWQENGRTRRWDAALDSGEQRRLGRILLLVAATPAFLVLAMLADTGLFGLAMLFAFPAMAWIVYSLRRLHRETHRSRP